MINNLLNAIFHGMLILVCAWLCYFNFKQYNYLKRKYGNKEENLLRFLGRDKW